MGLNKLDNDDIEEIENKMSQVLIRTANEHTDPSFPLDIRNSMIEFLRCLKYYREKKKEGAKI